MACSLPWRVPSVVRAARWIVSPSREPTYRTRKLLFLKLGGILLVLLVLDLLVCTFTFACLFVVGFVFNCFSFATLRFFYVKTRVLVQHVPVDAVNVQSNTHKTRLNKPTNRLYIRILRVVSKEKFQKQRGVMIRVKGCFPLKEQAFISAECA
jgi:hypothetical protein